MLSQMLSGLFALALGGGAGVDAQLMSKRLGDPLEGLEWASLGAGWVALWEGG